MISNNKKRIGVFIDGSNIWHCQKRNKWFIDFYKLKRYFHQRGEVKGLYYFTPEAPHLRGFLNILDKMGYSIVKKPLKKIKLKHKGKRRKFKHKGSLDLEMGLLMAANLDKYDEYIIMTGDSDFEVAVDLLKKSGKNIVTISNRNSLSREMRKASNHIVYLHEIKKEIRYRNKKSRPKPGLTPYE